MSEAPATLIMGVLGIILSLPAWFFFIRAAAKIYRLIASGKPSPNRINQPITRLFTMLKEVFFHTEMIRKPVVALAHWFVMLGFLIGAVVWFEAYIQTFAPDSGWPLLKNLSLYHFAEEVLAIGTIAGIIFLSTLRLNKGHRDRLSRFYGSNALAAFFVETIILTEGISMLLVKAAKIATYGHGSPWADFLSIHIATFLPASPNVVSALALTKLMVGMIWLYVMAYHITWGVGWHRFLAFFNIFFRRNPTGAKALGQLASMTDGNKVLTIDNVEDTDTFGTGRLTDASWKMLLDATTCTECGRCQEQCPAWHTEKPLSPKLFVTDIRDAAVANAEYLLNPETFQADTSHEGVDVLKLVGTSNIIHPNVLWSCTNCGACVEQCPVDIEHIDHIANLRRFQVLAESDFPSELTGMFKNLETKGNPWGRNASERSSWIEQARRDGIEVPVFGEDITDFEDTEYLFWVGCAGTFDEDGKKTTRAVVELLHTAGVKFAVLSRGETCTGDPARRAGNEFLFQQLAQENITTLDGVFTNVPRGQRKIITTCPHCFNTIRNEYPDFDGHYDVFHHTQLLNRLVREKLLTPIPRGPENRKPVTYHDPCFLGRHNKIFDPPRELIGATGATLVEMDRNRNEGFCCGAGGARMFMEEKIGTRINENRAAEAAATGAAEVAVGCPFCNTMMSSGLKTVAEKDAPQVKDVAQMLRDAVLVDGKLPTRNNPLFLDPKVRTPDTTGVSTVSKPKPAPDNKTAQDSASVKSGSPMPPGVPTPGTVTPHAKPAVPAPGAAVPGINPLPAAPVTPVTPEGSGSPVAAPGAAIPVPPGAAAPKISPPGATLPTPPGTSIPVPRIPTPGPSVPPAPGAATPIASPPLTPPIPPAPGGVLPAPGSASPPKSAQTQQKPQRAEEELQTD
ncbi:Protein fadF [Corynebacterium kutscheri]|uniref:Fe-S oxidoreductase n=1 Tax=Corynebacterium kutscheri TaxID=35755 RepID=A0A0F6R1T5_9CORY|nr:4Fe-4S dicluster domain-containing protein [Corynebacterium kutscheri]AKE42055.1 Fe-S oxidoreductase [Corynebacterium kutscheri]VEH10396.1 Protein fadF [Corynebacterium kutscheri]VEH81993.1 Protein fadF [Corynebacterium kutscheri]